MPRSVFTARYKRLLRLLVEARQERGLTQADLGKKLGQDQTFVSKYEHGVRRLDVIEFLDVTKALGVDGLALLQTIKRKG